MDLTNSTVSGNTAGFGGGIYNFYGAVSLTNSTVSGNSADFGGGIYNSYGTVTLNNTIVANSTGGDVVSFGGPLTGSHNLVEDGSDGLGDTITGDPLLGPLASNGGPTPTHALLPGSPAIDAGDGTGAPATDQRGIARPQLGGTDIGAFESRGFTLAIAGGDNQSTPINTAFTNPLEVTVTSAFGEPVEGGVVRFSAPVGGAGASLSSSSATINAAGLASVTATANATLGSYVVAATTAGAARRSSST